MLPNTLNSKNRLFFERDSKNRRITAKIGNVFRNSKWSDYSIKNTNSINQYEFKMISRIVLKFLLILYFILVLYSYSIDVYFINFSSISNCIFDLIDFTDLSIFNFFENGKLFLLIINQIFWKIIFEKLFSNNLINFSLFQTIYTIKPSSLNSNNRDDNELKNYNSNITNLPFFYTSNSVLKVISNDSIVTNNLINSTLQHSYKNNLILVRPNFNNNKINYNTITNSINDLVILSKMNKWFITNLTFTNNLSNSFYINNLNYQFLNQLVLNNHLQLTSFNVISQNNIAKTLRWSYRYSNLHRKTIINSHKLTSVKKLLGSGFFDSTSTKNNIWFSDNFSRIDNFNDLSKTLNTHWMMMYKSNLITKDTKNYLTLNYFSKLNSNFNFLSFYESSFQFFLKRLYLYSSMNSNNFLTKPNYFINTKVIDSYSTNNYNLYFNNFLKKNFITDDIFNPFVLDYKTKPINASVNSNRLERDVNINLIDHDFLLNDNLELLINLNNSLLEKGSNIKFFDINKNIVFKSSNYESRKKRNF